MGSSVRSALPSLAAGELHARTATLCAWQKTGVQQHVVLYVLYVQLARFFGTRTAVQHIHTRKTSLQVRRCGGTQ